MLWTLPLALLLLPAFADDCSNSRAPACPTNGVRILDESSFPPRAIVISYSLDGGRRGLQTPVRAAIETFRAFENNPSTAPFVIVPAEASEFQEFVSNFRTELLNRGELTPAAIDTLVAKIRPAETPSYTWQQDYFEATFDPATGNPALRFSPIYDARSTTPTYKKKVEAVAGALTCGLSLGQDFVSAFKMGTPEAIASNGPLATPAAEYGGNIEGLPGGLCLIGNNMLPAFAAQACGPESTQVTIDVRWLEVGHVDEIFKSVPDRRNIPGRPPECAFTILSADTDLGYSLLAGAGVANRNVISLRPSPDRGDVRYGYESPGEQALCEAGAAAGSSAPAQNGQGGEGSKVRGAFMKFFIDDVVADVPNDTCYEGMRKLTNRSLSNYLGGYKDLREYNQIIQRSLVNSRQVIYDKIMGRLPQCRRFFPDTASMFTPVPNIFSPQNLTNAAAHITTINGKKELVRSDNGANSLFPNPANALVMNNTIIFPGPLASPYDDYLKEKVGALGLTTANVETWDYAHVRNGNIHCATHVIPYCAPGAAQ
jgi:hypothetical protein